MKKPAMTQRGRKPTLENSSGLADVYFFVFFRGVHFQISGRIWNKLAIMRTQKGKRRPQKGERHNKTSMRTNGVQIRRFRFFLWPTEVPIVFSGMFVLFFFFVFFFEGFKNISETWRWFLIFYNVLFQGFVFYFSVLGFNNFEQTSEKSG